jgi:hypothetical protein
LRAALLERATPLWEAFRQRVPESVAVIDAYQAALGN